MKTTLFIAASFLLMLLGLIYHEECAVQQKEIQETELEDVENENKFELQDTLDIKKPIDNFERDRFTAYLKQ